jgi:hypothetical protein
MAGVWADDGIKAELDAMTGSSPISTAKLRLFKSNTTPSNATVLSDLTEATFAGYSAISLSGWSAAVVTAHVAQSDPSPGTFTITSGTQAIYGWYVTDSGNTKLLWAQRDTGAPITLDASGLSQYTVTASVQTKDTAT